MFEPEERRIVERIKDFIKNEDPSEHVYIILKNGRIINIHDYFSMVSAGKINPQDAYVHIGLGFVSSKSVSSKSIFYYPFLEWYIDLFRAYLSTLGLYRFYSSEYHISPATDLKYVAYAVEVHKEYLTIEVSDLNTAVNNTNLRKIVFEVMGEKIISGEKELTPGEDGKINRMFKSQKLFAGHDFEDASGIIHDYYNKGNQSLAKEVARIAIDYDRIFNPYTVCYDMKTWKEVVCSSIKLD